MIRSSAVILRDEEQEEEPPPYACVDTAVSLRLATAAALAPE